MATTINIKGDLTKAQLRALKITADDLIPGAELTVGNATIKVSVPQESDIRAFARANGIAVGSRGRYSKELTEAWEKHQRLTEARREAGKKGAAARAAKRAAASEPVNA